MNWLRRYKNILVVALLSLFVGGGVVFSAATLFHQTDVAEQSAVEKSTKKIAPVKRQVAKNRHTIKSEQKRNRVIERIVIRSGIAKRGKDGKLGPAGPRGRTGLRGATGPPPIVDYAQLARQLSRNLTDAEVARLAAAICATHRCQGMDGKDGAPGAPAKITDAEIKRAADLICGSPAPCPPAPGPPGPAGPAAPPIASFGFSPPPTGPHYTCTDPEGDGTYECVPDGP